MNGYLAKLKLNLVSVRSAKVLTGISRDGLQRLRKMTTADERLASNPGESRTGQKAHRRIPKGNPRLL